MAKGVPSYFLLHDIITGQYTPGNEFVLSAGEDYIGMYHKLPNNEYWTEEKPSRTAKLLGIKRTDLSDTVNLYNRLNKITQNNYVSPIVAQPIITLNEYAVGYVLRFFVQKRNNPLVTIQEIDGEQYSSINTSNFVGINGVIWNHTAIRWSITGKNALELNKKAIIEASKNFLGLQYYLTDFLEFSK